MADTATAFAALKGKLSKKKGVADPVALAVSIGRKKMGRAAFAKKAAYGRHAAVAKRAMQTGK